MGMVERRSDEAFSPRRRKNGLRDRHYTWYNRSRQKLGTLQASRTMGGIRRAETLRIGMGSFITLLLIGMPVGHWSDSHALWEECYSSQQRAPHPQLAGLPRGNWSFSAIPTVRPGHETIPVDVWSVTSDARRGLAVTKVQLKNRSAKTVTAVRLAWDVIELSDPNRILLQGQTPLIRLETPLRAGERVALEHFVVAFADIAASLRAPGSEVLSGDYRLEVGVGEIVYEDGSRWTREDPHGINPKGPTPAASRVSPQSGCPNQICFWDVQRECYVCRSTGGSEGFGCTIPTRDSLQCTGWRCSAPPEEPLGASLCCGR